MMRPVRVLLSLVLAAGLAVPAQAQTEAAAPAAAPGAATSPAVPAAAQPAEPPVPAAAPRPKVVSLSAPQALAGPKAEVVSLQGPSIDGMPVDVAVNKTVQLTTLPAEARDIIVGSSDVADVIVRSPTQVFVVGRGLGQTNIQFRDKNGRTIRRIDVSVHVDTAALKEALSQVLPDETGLKVSAVGDSIYLSGSVRNDAAATTARALARRFVKEDANVVNLLRVNNEQQVLLKVKVAEIKKNALKELGVGEVWNGVANIGGVRLSNSNTQPRTGSWTYSNSTANGASTGWVPTTADTWLSFGSGTLTNLGGAFTALTLGLGQLSSTFTMLESQNLLRTLEEPNLTAVSGETASMLAGGEFPVPVSVTNGQVAVEFKKFGVGLSFTPVVLDPGRISLKLQTEVSDVDKTFNVAVGNLSVYGLKVRRAGSVVEMPSGGSIMIAGLLQNDISQVAAGFPGLMDVPVLGRLFRSDSFQHNESELVVIVSAYIVQPTSGNQLMGGGEGFAPASDLSRFLFNSLQDRYVRSRQLPPVPAQLQGPFGYVVE